MTGLWLIKLDQRPPRKGMYRLDHMNFQTKMKAWLTALRYPLILYPSCLKRIKAQCWQNNKPAIVKELKTK